jgi:hypothetical protein
MTVQKFAWIAWATLLMGYSLVIYFIPDNLMAPGFINLGMLVVLTIAAFLIKKDDTQNSPKCDVDDGTNTDVTHQEPDIVGRSSDNSKLSDPDSRSED